MEQTPTKEIEAPSLTLDEMWSLISLVDSSISEAQEMNEQAPDTEKPAICEYISGLETIQNKLNLIRQYKTATGSESK